MARGIIRKPSFNKIIGAYRSQWKRFWMKLFTFGMYGRKGMGWWKDPKKAWYNFWYNRSSISVYRILGCKPSRGACFFAMLCASVVSIFAAPIDATRAGITAYKIRKKRKARAKGTSTGKSGGGMFGTSSRSDSSYASSGGDATETSAESRNTSSTPRTSSTRTSNPTSSATRTASSLPKATASKSPKEPASRKTPSASVKVFPPVEEKEGAPKNGSVTALFSEPVPYIPHRSEEPKEPDENTPKSKPMDEGDQYIRKRMVIAGSFYCDQAVISQLTAGTYFDFIAEPDNPHDKGAIALYCQGCKIGYVAKKDVTPFAMCLKLRRNIYGVVTDIREKDGQKEIEYEAWFSNKR